MSANEKRIAAARALLFFRDRLLEAQGAAFQAEQLYREAEQKFCEASNGETDQYMLIVGDHALQVSEDWPEVQRGKRVSFYRCDRDTDLPAGFDRRGLCAHNNVNGFCPICDRQSIAVTGRDGVDSSSAGEG